MLLLCLVLVFISHSHSHNVHLSKRIINGVNITAYDSPYYAMLYYGGVHSGGAIIQDNVILTAASVVDGFSNTDIEIFVGVSSIADTYVRFPYDNNRTIKHPQYTPGKADYDVALMFLEDKLGMGGPVQAINLSTTPAPVNSRVKLSGFGYPKCNRTSNPSDRCVGVASYTLRSGDFRVNGYVGNVMYATGYNGVSSCFGDFGGPVVLNNTLVGIASLIQYQNCTGNNLIVSIPAVLPWIRATIQQQPPARKAIRLLYDK